MWMGGKSSDQAMTATWYTLTSRIESPEPWKEFGDKINRTQIDNMRYVKVGNNQFCLGEEESHEEETFDLDLAG